MAIQSFGDKVTEEFFFGGQVKKGIRWSAARKVAQRKLDMIHYASVLSDLRSPPGNHLEALKGTLSGYHSIRINDQWRIIFRWSLSGPEEVRIADYH